MFQLFKDWGLRKIPIFRGELKNLVPIRKCSGTVRKCWAFHWLVTSVGFNIVTFSFLNCLHVGMVCWQVVGPCVRSISILTSGQLGPVRCDQECYRTILCKCCLSSHICTGCQAPVCVVCPIMCLVHYMYVCRLPALACHVSGHVMCSHVTRAVAKTL
jgi:hypothetical protein